MPNPNTGPAFPQPFVIETNGESYVDQPGMTLRDYFAAKALVGFLSVEDDSFSPEGMAESAYRLADAMLEAREK